MTSSHGCIKHSWEQDPVHRKRNGKPRWICRACGAGMGRRDPLKGLIAPADGEGHASPKLRAARGRFYRTIQDVRTGRLVVPPIDPWPHVAGVYFVCADRIKIGVSRDVAGRLDSFLTSSPYKPLLLAVVPGGREEEQSLHKRFKEHRVRREWFSMAPDLMLYIAAQRGVTAGE